MPASPTLPATFSVAQLATAVNVSPQTIRRSIAAGELKAAQNGNHGHFRISQTEAERWWRRRGGGGFLNGSVASESSEERAKAILAAMDSGDVVLRNAAIIDLAWADEKTIEIVEEQVAKSVAEYEGPDDDFADWHALDGEPFATEDEEQID